MMTGTAEVRRDDGLGAVRAIRSSRGRSVCLTLGSVLALAVAAFVPQGSASAQERIIPPGMEGIYERFHYAPAVRVGNTLYVSGMVSGNPDPTAQFNEIFTQLSRVLEAAGSSLADIVDMTTFHVDMPDHIDAFMAVKDEYFTEEYPTWTAIGVEQLFTPAFLVEVKVVALIPES